MPIRSPTRALAVASVGLLILAACATPASAPAQAAASIDLQRYMGPWHVIAHVPYFAERGHVASSDDYSLRPDGKIGVRYRYREGFDQPQKTFDSRASVKPGTGNREWTTWFFGVIPTKYRIVEVAPDYTWALIDYPGRELAWVFARSPQMDDATYADLTRRMRGHGVDISLLKRIPQTVDQVGKPDFAAPKKS